MNATEHQPYRYDQSVKSDVSDELINVYVIRPLAGVLVRFLYHTSVTPNQVTIIAALTGFAGAALYFAANPATTLLVGVCVTLKDILDSADGQLARAKQLYSRSGRFLDSIGDFLVNLSLFTAIGFLLTTSQDNPVYAFLALMGLLGTTLRVSYHVYYHTSFLHIQKEYPVNRVTEEIREADLGTDQATLILQRVFQILYGWQDRLMVRIDRWCRPPDMGETFWFADRVGLRLSGFLGLGTELFLLTIASVTNQLKLYVWWNLVVMNGVWLASVLYRRWGLTSSQKDAGAFTRGREL